jgi:2-oxo-3-hexenedioate decarboxylase
MTDLFDLAARLDQAALFGRAMAQPDLGSAEDGYAVQADLVSRRLARGDTPAGVKLGFTSTAKMAQMGISEVIIGRLTRDAAVADGGVLDISGLIHPRVEPEVAFRIAGAEAPYVDAVAPAVEIIDSRYRDFRFSLGDVIADNTSAAAYVIGSWLPLDRTGIGNRGVLLEIDGAVVETGSTAAILGDPMRAIGRALALAARLGIPVPAGSILLAGAATAAAPLAGGAHVRATVAGLGTAGFRTTGGAS